MKDNSANFCFERSEMRQYPLFRPRSSPSTLKPKAHFVPPNEESRSRSPPTVIYSYYRSKPPISNPNTTLFILFLFIDPLLSNSLSTMETPSSARRVTRLQAANLIPEKSKQELSNKGGDREIRAALVDITNDSPIVGLASGSLTAEKTLSLSSPAVRARRTSGSGEDALRGQVQTLLQKVEEEGEIVKEGYVAADFVFPCVRSREDLQKVVEDFKLEEPTLDPQECLINRELMFDDKSDIWVSNYQSSRSLIEKSSEDDNSSTWSIQVNTSTVSDELVEDLEEEGDINYDGIEAEEEDDAGDLLGDLCDDLRKMSMGDDDQKPKLPEFVGRHTRFIYNSEDEMEGEEEVKDKKAVSPSLLVLKGLPAPEGKHLRFHEEEEEEEDN
ncbi:hypothetical protein Cni_G07751 [Canna indica]|uniref:Uncharacterized protein n=1 Tax=Canna indica TaxID=4628 RepID=A0AAQ3Q7V8_9LILI|nr:hypothetical protein Cni_G07751 [Canna indica]